MPGRFPTRISTKERQDITSGGAPNANSLLVIIRAAMMLATYIIASSCLIRFNKFLVHKDRFPYPMALATAHMLTSSVLCLTLYALDPSYFPGIASTHGQRMIILRWCAPIALCFAVSLYTSNQAYMYCSVAFLQFMKEGHVIIVFLLSVAAGLQVLTRLRVALIVWIVASSSLAVCGELHFAWLGFVLQLVSSLAECSKNVLGEFLLNGNRVKLDALSFTMSVAPTCFFALTVGLAASWDPKIPQAFCEWWHYLLPNAALAFMLNVLVAAVIKEVSAVGFVLAGLFKDITLVTLSCLIFSEDVTRRQVCSFVATVAGVFCWSYLKACPDSDAAIFAARLFGDRPEGKQPAADAAAAAAAAGAEPGESTALCAALGAAQRKV